MHKTTIVYTSHVNHFPPSRLCNVLGQSLVGESFKGGLDDVHLVSGSRGSCGQILDSRGSGEFVDEMLAAVAEACKSVSRYSSYRSRTQDIIPGGLADSFTTLAPTFASTSP